jgi:hypothetical protein
MARPLGSQNKDKPFATALRMELAALGDDDPKALRGLARNLIAIAAGSENALPAIKEIADRLDGKPAQESTVTIDDKRDATDWTRDELVAFLRNATPDSAGATEANGRGRKSDRVH